MSLNRTADVLGNIYSLVQQRRAEVSVADPRHSPRAQYLQQRGEEEFLRNLAEHVWGWQQDAQLERWV
ncbi:hypothetical protein J2D73_19995 [Acetobacter sacchari]|uniref:Uncharacterized protein n=1 Tax=Acetobacter sacchari TaxID=2661687 RepID=A0ABS3M1Q9_9PROT|nr:hypothetical protein [Acetobacter sacchari]MBO1362067.1 hypothetical protein [Acetobacter sacchari]